MILVDIVNRPAKSRAWGEGEYIPWEDEQFSRTILGQRLDGETNEFSRPLDTIEYQANYIHKNILAEKPIKVLGISCGPGLLLNALAKQGHECVGYSPSTAEIAYAKEQAEQDKLSCMYYENDFYSFQYGSGYGLIIMDFGQFNSFSPMDAYEILGKAWRALEEGGILLLEPYSFESLETLGRSAPSWEAYSSGPFSVEPYLCLKENVWNDANGSMTKRWYIVDTASSNVRLIAQAYQAYTEKHLKKLLAKRHFINPAIHPSVEYSDERNEGEFYFIAAEKTTKYVNT